MVKNTANIDVGTAAKVLGAQSKCVLWRERVSLTAAAAAASICAATPPRRDKHVVATKNIICSPTTAAGAPTQMFAVKTTQISNYLCSDVLQL